jgi:cell division septation protein DedD
MVETSEIVMQSAVPAVVKPGSPDKQLIAGIGGADRADASVRADIPQQQSLATGASLAGIDTGSQAPALPVLPSDTELSMAKYSIQVGMYGSLQNAENMVELLRAKGMQAYVSEYLNSRNELRYNVRFGFFADKGNALAMLEQYKSRLQGDGYLVRFSAESLARLSAARERDASAVEQPAKTEQVDSTS